MFRHKSFLKCIFVLCSEKALTIFFLELLIFALLENFQIAFEMKFAFVGNLPPSVLFSNTVGIVSFVFLIFAGFNCYQKKSAINGTTHTENLQCHTFKCICSVFFIGGI